MKHPLSQKLYDEFYDCGKAKHSSKMSSHWSNYANYFSLSNDKKGNARLLGFGFGESDQKPSLRGRALGWLEILIKTIFYFPIKEMASLILWGRQIVRKMNLYFGQDAFRHLCVLILLKKNLPSVPRKILIIGDGPGILSALFHETWPEAQIFLIDLGVTLAIQAQNLTRAFPGTSHKEGVGEESGFYYLAAERLNLPRNISFDLAVNVASMQEMKPETVKEYFQLLRTHATGWFYCCNRVEKVMPEGEVSRFYDYPWKQGDEIIVEGYPKWYGWFLGLGGFPVVSWGSFQLPLLRRYDGVHAHRFIRMAPS